MGLPSFTKLTAAVYVNGVKPAKADVRKWGLEVETGINALFGNPAAPMFNGKIVPSVSGNALTIALKTIAGADPSAGDPVYVPFRKPTETDGNLEYFAITGALGLTISGTSLMGVGNGDYPRLWVKIFNDGGVARLALVNCFDAVNGIVFSLADGEVESATAEGSGAADSAGVIYAAATITAKASRIVASLDWETALATGGLWSAVPDRVVPFGPGVPRPGDIIARTRAMLQTVATGSTQLPYDNTIPQSGEGAQFITATLSARSKCNVVAANALASVSQSTGTQKCSAAIFRDSVANALSAAALTLGTGVINQIALATGLQRVGATLLTTFKLRAGMDAAGNFYLNGIAGTQAFGGVASSFLEALEIKT